MKTFGHLLVFAALTLPNLAIANDDSAMDEALSVESSTVTTVVTPVEMPSSGEALNFEYDVDGSGTVQNFRLTDLSNRSLLAGYCEPICFPNPGGGQTCYVPVGCPSGSGGGPIVLEVLPDPLIVQFLPQSDADEPSTIDMSIRFGPQTDSDQIQNIITTLQRPATAVEQ